VSRNSFQGKEGIELERKWTRHGIEVGDKCSCLLENLVCRASCP